MVLNLFGFGIPNKDKLIMIPDVFRLHFIIFYFVTFLPLVDALLKLVCKSSKYT